MAKIEDFALHQRVRRYRKMASKARGLAAELQYDRSDLFLEVADKWDRLAKLTEAVIESQRVPGACLRARPKESTSSA